MNKVKSILLVFSIFSVIQCSAQKSEVKRIKEVITAFSEAGDKNDGPALEKHLDDNYRVVMNRMFGSKSVATMDKSTYVENVESKVFGGDKRDLSIKKVLINGNVASALVTFKGTKMTVVSVLVLVKGANGVWKIVSDNPSIK